ncbi:MAG: DNA repair protein RadA, partial [Oscillospiraceae bacterium]|nr:DNA repair protein RadA [Oscillospiraceae bacterium]
LLLAVLEKRGGWYFSSLDAYLNVIGGLRLEEPAADLPVALSLVSSLKDTVMGEGIVACGEVGLAGEIRAVSHIDARISEAARLGFTKILIPSHNIKAAVKRGGIEVAGVATVREAFEEIHNA